MPSSYLVGSTKTTFFLSDSRRARLKSVAAARGVTVTDLLAEGADLVLAKYERAQDRERLLVKARDARQRLRAGLFDGRMSSSEIDDVLYAPTAHSQSTKGRRSRRGT